MCHSLDGYLAIRPLVAGQDAEGLIAFLEALRAGRPGMPPIVGTDKEIQALAAYLASLDGAGNGGALEMTFPAIPALDPTPLPAPAWLFQVLLLVTFFVHLVFLNVTLGGTLIAQTTRCSRRARMHRAVGWGRFMVEPFAVERVVHRDHRRRAAPLHPTPVRPGVLRSDRPDRDGSGSRSCR